METVPPPRPDPPPPAATVSSGPVPPPDPRPAGPQPLDPRVRRVWHLLAALGALPFTAAGIVAALVGVAEDVPVLVAGGGAGAVVVVLVAAMGPRLRYRTWRWELTPEGLEISHGVLVRTASAVPVFRVQQIDVRQGPIERAFGVVQLQITTASAASDGVLPGLDPERAEAVRRELLGRVAADDGV